MTLRPIAFLLILTAAVVAQAPTIGIVDLYGVRRLQPEKLRNAIGVASGDPVPASKADLEEKVESLPDVVRSEVTAHCCEQGKVVLYIGVEEKGAPHFDYHDVPDGEAALPEYVVENYRGFLVAVSRAGAAGKLAEDLSKGHSLMANNDVRQFQDRFSIHAELHLEKLREVLRTSSNPESRAVAAHLLGYAQNKRVVINDLQYALRDPDENVRSNALRALSAIAVLGQSDAELGIKVAPTWFVEMLHSIVWSDRYQAARALVRLTEHYDPGTIELLRERAVQPVVEMARWKHLPHALPAFFLAGRMAGIEDREIEAAWLRADRDSVLSRLTASLSTSSTR
jgi:hypothetical protein